ncbi:hypothetical protein BSU04_14625 [Caballeronia sordidicola]|uniref:Uncharacterized protein n=1 Tax=Caballeronia sordidicola TaxID=196367 RepID=A0A226X4Z6_CABSO|nr:hypothetical protein BSU04_14625 [Caballeronia sordidicola]
MRVGDTAIFFEKIDRNVATILMHMEPLNCIGIRSIVDDDYVRHL